MGNIGARYDLSPNANIYASYSRGYKGAGYNVAFTAQSSDQPVDPEKVDAYEAGLKMSTADGVLSLNLAGFYSKYKNFQAQAQIPGDLAFVLANAGSISSRGFEAEATVKPNDLLTLNLGASIINAHIDKFPGGPCYTGQTEAQGCIDGAQDLAGADLRTALQN